LSWLLMKNDRRHATGSGGGRLAQEDRTGKSTVDFVSAKGGAGRSSSSKEHEDPEQIWVGGLSKSRLKRLLIVGVAATLVLVAIIWNVLDKRDAKGVVEPAAGRTDFSKSRPTMVDTVSAEELRTAAEDVVRGFMEAGTTEERMKFVLPDDGLAERMEEYYRRPEAPAPAGFGEMVVFEPAAFDGVPVYWTESTESSGARRQFFNLIPLRDRMVIEWESSVIYGAMSWAVFVAEKPTEPVQMRVLLTGSDYYNHQYADESAYEAFEIVAEELGEEWLYAYGERGSEVGFALSRVRAVPGEHQYNLMLRWTEGAASRGVRIEEVIHLYWADADSLLKRISRLEGE
jgi:hypothetical protein